MTTTGSGLWQSIVGLIHPASQLPDEWRDRLWQDVPFLAIDLELNGLDVETAKVLSIGWVAGQHHQIEVGTGYYLVTRAKGDLQQSPVIHGLIAEDVAQGGHIREAMELLLGLAQTHVWVFHNANLDLDILRRVFRLLGTEPPCIIALDTLKLAIYQLSKQHEVLPPNSATLAICRQRYGFPLASAHHALDDAMATLELLYAQLNELDPEAKMPLAELLHTKALSVNKASKTSA